MKSWTGIILIRLGDQRRILVNNILKLWVPLQAGNFLFISVITSCLISSVLREVT